MVLIDSKQHYIHVSISGIRRTSMAPHINTLDSKDRPSKTTSSSVMHSNAATTDTTQSISEGDRAACGTSTFGGQICEGLPPHLQVKIIQQLTLGMATAEGDLQGGPYNQQLSRWLMEGKTEEPWTGDWLTACSASGSTSVGSNVSETASFSHVHIPAAVRAIHQDECPVSGSVDGRSGAKLLDQGTDDHSNHMSIEKVDSSEVGSFVVVNANASSAFSTYSFDML
jgi:hypothetical protein